MDHGYGQIATIESVTGVDRVSDWAAEAMNWAVSTGLINGVTETELAPQATATRAQMAAILMRYCQG